MYVGGGSIGAVCSGVEFCRGGKRGGRFGLGGFVAIAGLEGLFIPSGPLPMRRTGGAGMFEVLMPVRLARNGTGGGAGFCAACPCSCCWSCGVRLRSTEMGEPRAWRDGETAFVGEDVALP